MPPLSPAQVYPFNVIQLPIAISGDPRPRPHSFVVLNNFRDEQFLVGLDPVLNVSAYDPTDLGIGCVLYAAGLAPGFATEVVFEPRERYRQTLPYGDIQRAMDRGMFTDRGPLPDFKARFLDAIERNRLLNRDEKERWRKLVS